MSQYLSPAILLTIFATLNIFANEEIIISADRIDSNQHSTTSKIELIDRNQIRTLQSTNLEDLLNKASDLNIVKSGAIGNTSSIFMRGMDASHTLVVLDGIILNDPSNPNRQFDISKINLNNIDKIEILKGSQGLLYGSNAIGGVIVLYSKKPFKSELNGSIAYGSYQSTSISTNWNHVLQNKDLFNAGIVVNNSKGYSSASDPSHPNDNDGLSKIFFNLGYAGHLPNEILYDFKFNFNHEKIDLDKGGGLNADDPNYLSKNQNIFSKISFEKLINEQVKSKFQYSNTQYLRRSFDQNDSYQTYDGTNFARGNNHAIELDNTFFYNDFLTSDLNIGHSIESDGKNSNSNSNIFLYNRFEYGPALVNAGLRFDYNKIFNEAITYKVALGHKFNLFDLHLSHSTGFRAPSLNQLYDKTYGNRNLSPERSKSTDIGLLIERSIISIDTTLFYNHLENRLSYHPSTFVNLNAGNSYSKGIEETIKIKLNENLTSQLKYVLTESFDLSSGKRLARRPESLFIHSYHYENDKFQGDFNLKFKSFTRDVDNNGNDTLNKKYVTLNSSVNFELSNTSSVALVLENILNSNFQEVWGYNNGGRMFNLRYNLKF